MTVRIPPDSIWDRILKLLGKERRIFFPPGADEVYKRLGPHVQIKGCKESFLKALFRRN